MKVNVIRQFKLTGPPHGLPSTLVRAGAVLDVSDDGGQYLIDLGLATPTGEPPTASATTQGPKPKKKRGPGRPRKADKE